jgi:alkaline phosphatase D
VDGHIRGAERQGDRIMSCLIHRLVIGALCIVSVLSVSPARGDSYRNAFAESVERIWVGPEFWGNRNHDWRLRNGRVECVLAANDRNLQLLTHQVEDGGQSFRMSVRLGLEATGDASDESWLGVRLGVSGAFDDYRDSAVHGRGIDVGVTTSGSVFMTDRGRTEADEELAAALRDGGVLLTITGRRVDDRFNVTARVSIEGTETDRSIATALPGEQVAGNVALLSHLPKLRKSAGGTAAWFDDLVVYGDCVKGHEEQTYGPIMFVQYTLSEGVMKLTAQMAPVGAQDGDEVELQLRSGAGWRTVGAAPIDALARTAEFRIEGWDGSRDVPYRVRYEIATGPGERAAHTFEGTIRRDPVDAEELVVAGFTGNNDLGFPNNDVVRSVASHDPDLLFFSGDQIYEGVGGYGCQRSPLEGACLDYLRKWYIFGWVYRDLMRDRPTISIPDDHDVFHGNIWGAWGKATQRTGNGAEQQDSGGYKMPAEFVRMVERTQTSHLPDPFDPVPAHQGIGVYFCDMTYGGVSFAVLEDRKFKSAPKPMLPAAKIWNGWPQNPDFDATAEGDTPGASLLGERQLRFIRSWAQDWSNDVWMKVALSQTIFANVATLPEKEMSDANVPRLRILKEGEYPPDDVPVSDFDSNGWPQTGRNAALRALRTGFAFHIAGDQHLGSTIQYGVDSFNDAGWAFCVPAVSNIWPRRWCPKEPGGNREPGAPRYTGEYLDGFGNHVTVHAVSNPVYTGIEPSRLYDRATGYGIVRLRRADRSITIECWARASGANGVEPHQYPGWPIRISQFDNAGPTFGHLPELRFEGGREPVVRVIDEANGQLIYTVRAPGTAWKPVVFRDGTYTVVVSNDAGGSRRIEGLRLGADAPPITVDLRIPIMPDR